MPHRPDCQLEKRTRLLVSFWPQARLGSIGVPLLACAWIVGSSLSLLIVFAILAPILERLESCTWLGPVGICFVLAASTWGVFWIANRIASRRLRRKRPYRWDRLQRLLARPGAAARFPHRVAERAFYASPHFPMRHGKVVRMARPGQLILCNVLRPAYETTPRPNDIPFEPIELEEQSERAAAYICTSIEAQGVNIDDLKAKYAAAKHTRRRRRLSTRQFRVLSLLAAVASSGGILSAFGNTGRLVWVLAMAIALLAGLERLFYECTWWIVPGGLICREFRFWRSRMKVYHFTARNTPLMLDARHSHGYVLHEQRVMRISNATVWWWAVASAWISTASPPTMEQIREFAGIEAAASDSTGGEVT